MVKNNKLKIIKIILIYLIIHFCFMHNNYSTVLFYIKSKVYKNNTASIPINKNAFNIVINYILKIPNFNSFKFIDFGCGYGEVLCKVKHLFDRIEGIDINKEISIKATNYISNYNNIKVINKNGLCSTNIQQGISKNDEYF